MEGISTKGVLTQLDLLEAKARSRNVEPQRQDRVKELKASLEALVLQRDQLKAKIEVHESIQKLRASMDKGEEEMHDGSDKSRLLWLMARHAQLVELLSAHDLIGYSVVKTRQQKGVCISLPTAYDGVYLDTYNLEIDLAPTLRISRHNIPPFIPLNSLAEQSNMQTDIRAFLDTLSQHLHAFAGRKQQLKLVKELHKSAEVMESNVLCSILVLMLTTPLENTAVLCTLDYSDRTRCLPTRVIIESEDKELPDSAQWKKSCTLLKETPVHKALTTMKKMGIIV
ncbi:centromere protein O [Diretmus argenteus]